jgi:GR25 family glycosyltransferase involved in LPS biosynthesis
MMYRTRAVLWSVLWSAAWAIDGTFITHYKPLVERKTALMQTLTAAGLCGTASPCHWVVDYDADPASPTLLSKFYDPLRFTDRTNETHAVVHYRRLHQSHISIYLKHAEALRQVVRRGLGAALIIEDDAVFEAGTFKDALDRYVAEADSLAGGLAALGEGDRVAALADAEKARRGFADQVPEEVEEEEEEEGGGQSYTEGTGASGGAEGTEEAEAVHRRLAQGQHQWDILCVGRSLDWIYGTCAANPECQSRPPGSGSVYRKRFSGGTLSAEADPGGHSAAHYIGPHNLMRDIVGYVVSLRGARKLLRAPLLPLAISVDFQLTYLANLQVHALIHIRIHIYTCIPCKLTADVPGTSPSTAAGSGDVLGGARAGGTGHGGGQVPERGQEGSHAGTGGGGGGSGAGSGGGGWGGRGRRHRRHVSRAA